MLKLKVVVSLETGIIDTGSFGIRTEGPPNDRRSTSARVQATVPQCCCAAATCDLNTQFRAHILLWQSRGQEVTFECAIARDMIIF